MTYGLGNHTESFFLKNASLALVRSENWQSHPASRRGSCLPEVDRPLPVGGLADRLRNSVQHERQRSHLEPRH